MTHGVAFKDQRVFWCKLFLRGRVQSVQIKRLYPDHDLFDSHRNTASASVPLPHCRKLQYRSRSSSSSKYRATCRLARFQYVDRHRVRGTVLVERALPYRDRFLVAFGGEILDRVPQILEDLGSELRTSEFRLV